MPHAIVVTQKWQPTKDRKEDFFASEDDCRKGKSAIAYVIGHIPKPRFVACPILGKVIAVVPQTANASIELQKTKALRCLAQGS